MKHLEDLLRRIGQTELGKTQVSPETKFEGEAIALSERENGDKSFVIVAWVGGRLGIKADPKAFGSKFSRILTVYRYEDPEKIIEKGPARMTNEEVTEALIEKGLTKEQVENLGNLTTKREALKRILDDKIAPSKNN